MYRQYSSILAFLLISGCGAGSSSSSTTITEIANTADTVKPVISAPDPITVAANDAFGTPASDADIVAFLTAATASDNIDGSVSVTNNSPTQFDMGETSVTFTATDAAGNTDMVSVTVMVADITGPLISRPANIAITAESADGVAASASVIVDFLSAASGEDNVDQSVTVTNNAPVVFPIGVTGVSFSAVDSVGNTAVSVTATVTVSLIEVVDTTAPVVTPPADIVVLAGDASEAYITDSAIVAFLASASALDDTDGAVAVSDDAPSVFALGETRVTFTAVDAAGNTSQSVTAAVTVVSALVQLSGQRVTLQDYNPTTQATVSNEFVVEIVEGAVSTDLSSVPLNLTNIINGTATPVGDYSDALLRFSIDQVRPIGAGSGTVDLIVTTGADGDRAESESQLHCQLQINWQSDGSIIAITEPEQSISLVVNRAGLKITTTINEFDIMSVTVDQTTGAATLDIKLLSALSEGVKVAGGLLDTLLVPRTLHIKVATTMPIADADGVDVSEINAIIKLDN